MTPPLHRPDALASEEGFLQAVIDLAKLRGWLCHHSRPALSRRGRWATHLAGDPGLPDLVLVRGATGSGAARLILAEIKSDKGRVSRVQHAWLTALRATAAEVYLWRPSMWPAIEKCLE